MKIYIDNRLRIHKENIIDLNLLNECGVYYQVDGDDILISEQKITLDEYDMNELFYNAFYSDGDIKMSYAAPGHEDFCIRLTKDEL